jgi:hypothetical protein
MANYVESALLAFQGRVRAGLAAHEVRELDTAVLQYALENTQFFETIMNINEIKQSTQRPVYGYQFNRITTANGSGMVTQPTGGMGTSVQVPLTFVSFTQTFQTFNVTGYDNVMSFAAIFDNQARQAMRQIRTGVREWLVTSLYGSRTAALPTEITSTIKNATWNAGNATYEVSGSNPYANITSVMRQAGYGSSTYDALFDATLYPQYQYSAAQGTMNAANLQYQFDKKPLQPTYQGGYFDNIWEELYLANDTGYEQGYALVMPKNAFAMVPWMPKIYYDERRSRDFASYTGGYGTIGDDMYDGMVYQLFGWNNQSDTSGSNGYAQSQTQNWQIGITLAFVPAYLSNPDETAIYGFALQP